MDDNQSDEPLAENDDRDRRHANRRRAAAPVETDMRTSERRQKRPGIAALLRAISHLGRQNESDTYTFEQRVTQITEQIRASDPSIAREIQCQRKPEMAEWERGLFRATLILHRDEAPPRLSLQLYTGTDEHPAPLQIGFYEADVVNLIAVPIAAFLTGTSEA